MSETKGRAWPPKAQPLYVNHTLMTKKTCKETLGLSWRRNAGWMRIVMGVVAGVAGVYGLYMLIRFGLAAVGQVLSMLLLAAVAVYLGQWGYKLRFRAYWMVQKNRWGDDTLEKTVRFYEDEVVQESRLGELRFGYDELTFIHEGKNIILLGFGDGTLMITKEGFEEGNWEEALAFLRKVAPPPPPKKPFKERWADARSRASANQAARQAPRTIQPAAREDDGEDDEDSGGFDISDDSWVDEMDAELEAQARAAAGEAGEADGEDSDDPEGPEDSDGAPDEPEDGEPEDDAKD